MAAVKAGPVIAADVDPATKKVAVGGYVCHPAPIVYHDKLKVTTLKVRNTGDRPVQIGSHFPFLRGQSARSSSTVAAAFGQHLNIPASTALRFEPGDEREVKLVPYGGKRGVYGFNNLVDGPTSGKAGDAARAKAVALAARRGFRSKP